MPTRKKRINVALPDHLMELLERALEIEEDAYFSVLAAKRDTQDARFISHKKFWSKH